MAHRANISASFRWRLALVAAFCLGLAGWSVYDGLIGYPAQRERALVYRSLKRDEDLQVDNRWKDRWKEVAAQRGWSTEDPGKPHTEADITVQFIMAGMIAPVGVLFLFFFIRNGGRWIEADENGLRTSWGRELQYEQITKLNKKKWRKKGIAVVHYEQEGRKKRVTLDDCKYDPDPTEAILREVESRLSAEQIVGGYAEPLPLDDEELDGEDLSHEGEADHPEEADTADKSTNA